MKTMTCKQLGGACDLHLQGEDADAVIKAQDKHLRAAVAAGDPTHEPALSDMKGRWKHPIKGMGWYKDTKRAFAALPED
jgi:predicted small metal-binding protein